MSSAKTVSVPRRRKPALIVQAVNLKGDRLLSTRQAAEVVGLSPKTLRQLRCDRQGPRCLKAGPSKQARVRYPLSALEAWVAGMAVRGG
jgi:predicted DNA-binding transcriptional regulator AlpA